MNVTRSLSLYCLIVALLLCCAGNTFAQAPLEPAQMPGNTAFYIIWRGAPAAEARKGNSLFALWDDADLAPARAAIADNILKRSDNKPKLSREELNEYLSLLENPFVLGYLSKPKVATATAASSQTSSEGKKATWDGTFFVYDRTGKEAVLTKAMERMRASGKEPPQVSEITIGNIKALKMLRTTGVSYWVENGRYAVGANEKSVLEKVLARLETKTATPDSLAQTAAYREAKPLLGSGLLEFFGHISHMESIADESSVSGVKVAPLLGSLKLDSVHALAGHITLEGTKTRIQGALLGDTSPGTLFDLWADGQAAPASLAFVPAGAISFTSSQTNFMGTYALIKRVVHAALPQTQQGNADMVDMIAQAKLGMPVPDALGMFTGEFASVQTDPRMDSSKQFYLLGIRKKPEVVKLIHTLATDNIISEKEEGGVDFLKLSLSNNKATATNLEKNSWHMAVADDALLIAGNTETLHRAIAGRAANASGGTFASTPEYSAGRSQYPEKVTSLSFYNFQKVDWSGAKERWIEENRKAAATKAASAQDGASGPSSSDWLLQVDPKVLARHLHFASGASWKDSSGVHFDEWLE